MSFEQERNYGSHAPSTGIDTSNGGGLRGPTTGGNGMNDDMTRRLDTVMNSPYAIEKLMVRLRQSIHSSREFSAFLKERCVLEERHAQSYKKLVRHTSEVLRRPDGRQDSYARHFAESLTLNERLADNGLQLANSLQIMSDELRETAEKSERGRKHWKHTTIDTEKGLTDADTARQKAQDRYNNAAEQYERARAGERTGKFGLKKGSQAQQEEAFKEKVDALDQEYSTKTRDAQNQRREYETTTRPNIARALQDIIAECDAALAMQLTKLASLTEKHIVSSGMAVAPIRRADGSGPEPRGLRHVAQDIDNHKDFVDYMTDGVEPPPMKGRSRRNTDVDLVNTPVQSVDKHNPRMSMDNYNSNRASYQTPQHESKPPQLPDIGGHSDSFGTSFESQRPGAQNRDSYLGGQSEIISKAPTNPLQQTGVTHDVAPSVGTGRGALSGPSLPSFDRGQPTQSSTGFGPPPRQATTGPSGLGQFSVPLSSETSRSDNYGRPIGSAPGQNLHSNEFTAPQGPPPRQNTTGLGGIGAATSPTRQDGLPPNQFGPPPRAGTMGAGTMGAGAIGAGVMGAGIMGSQGLNRDASPPRQEPFHSNTLGSSTGPLRSGTMGPNVQGQGAIPPPKYDQVGSTSRNQMPPTSAGAFSGRGGPAPGSFLDPGRNEGPYGNNTAARAQSPTEKRNLLSQGPPRPALPPNNPVFGMHLDELFRRDGMAVPALVFQCIQAIDTFGMHTEGIYRTSGSVQTVNQLKSQFDHDSTKVKLATPASFFNDINSVATLLKNFLRDLPDPLLTNHYYQSFINAAKEEDNIMRRDALHQNINGLPDASYATLRVLVLHLHRVAMNSDINKMNMKNLSVVFGPTIMGGSTNDAGWQTKVMETILAHTHDIFDPDE